MKKDIRKPGVSIALKGRKLKDRGHSGNCKCSFCPNRKAHLTSCICAICRARRHEKLDEKHRLAISRSTKGKKLSEVHKSKLSISGKKSYADNPQLRNSRRLDILNNPRDSKFFNTSIEQKVAKLLKSNKIDYRQNIRIKNIANVDFLLLPEKKIIIECDGCYWHACTKCGFDDIFDKRKVDEIKTRKMIEAGYRVIRLFQHEISTLTAEQLNCLLV